MNDRSRARVQRSRVMHDPPGLARAPRVPAVLSTDPARNVDQQGIAREIPALPDDRLIATWCSIGCPRWFAEQVRVHPVVRFQAVAVWCLVQDAREGRHVVNALTGEVRSARELVDAMREQYDTARREGLIHDRPDHTVGLGDR